ncbi:hypothetical protein [Microscilla marina]|uniref:Lipoprotein, putative n=1 Tax=Microscilla marina ATCC 23134 TaxID=313606 RepID=A1ZV30_MICM2|nr:hypothetical protein [Microscilla marina]EAY25808.1 lipoprotein, putative [Microscilla marina ATCC 23134]
MKKLFALLLVAGLFTFASCGGDKKTGTESDTTSVSDTSANTTTEPDKSTVETQVTDTIAKNDSTVVIDVDTVKKAEGETTDTTKK